MRPGGVWMILALVSMWVASLAGRGAIDQARSHPQKEPELSNPLPVP